MTLAEQQEDLARTVPTTKATATPESVLQAVLAAGPQDSREALARVLAAGFSPKQTRTARERLGVVVSRSGRRADARSTWALPGAAVQSSATSVPTHAQQVDAGRMMRFDMVKPIGSAKVSGHLVESELERKGKVFRRPAIQPVVRKGEASAALADAEHHGKPQVPRPGSTLTKADISAPLVKRLEPFQLALVERRVQIFKARGLDAEQASSLAVALLKRDAAGSRGVSCAECQNFSARGVCAASQHSSGQRDVHEVWACAYARRDSP